MMNAEQRLSAIDEMLQDLKVMREEYHIIFVERLNQLKKG